eukprot:TRINITY_DN8696_c0_g1_i8.p1 TRINITY_DN8696_c0_g1~~TRINITY_DN8696_c0_g1_i8.p1  ORF type:complete len:701 (+),score=134.75 TRINITY_DN8696_c0_g1_i8:1009-3111(+)
MADAKSSHDIFKKSFRLDFGAIEYGSDPCETSFLLENNQCLPVTWKLKFPNEYEVEVERWADNGMLTDGEAAIAQILDHELFRLSEKTGTLQHGETIALTVTYSPTLVGVHEIPVLLEFANGKKMAIMFCGKTLRNEDPFLHMYDDVMNLESMPIGGDIYPVQYYELFNAGSGVLEFNIDTTPLQKLKEENMDCDVIKCDVTSGEIAGGSRFLIPFIFQPLEPKEYTAVLDLTTNAGDKVAISVKGVAYNPTNQKKEEQIPTTQVAIPKCQKLMPAKQIASLTKEVFDFGYIPTNCIKRELVDITNTTGHDIFFHWDLSNPALALILDISPSSGLLFPGQSVVLRVTYKSGPLPSVHDFDIICTLGEAKKMVERPSSAEPIGEVLLAQSIERPYASTGNNRSGSSPRGHRPVAERMTRSFLNRTVTNESRNSNSSFGNRAGNDSITFREPSVQSRRLHTPIAEVVDEHGSRRYQIHPQNEYPLHLRLRAVVLTVPMYKQVRSDYDDFFSPLPVVGTLQPPEGEAPTKPMSFSDILSNGGDSFQALMKDLVSDLVMESVNDPSIKEAFDTLPEEPVPYYVHIRAPTLLTTPRDQSPGRGGHSSLTSSPVQERRQSTNTSPVMESRYIHPKASSESPTGHSQLEREPSGTSAPRSLLRDPLFGALLEDIYENTLFSIVREMALQDPSINLRKPVGIRHPLAE